MMLRVNQQYDSRDHYLERLQQSDIAAKAISQTSEGILLDAPCDVHQLPNFDKGYVSVQDGSAQLVADLLDIKPNQRILDLTNI